MSHGLANLDILRASQDVDFSIRGIIKYEVAGQTVWITTTHIALLIIMLGLIVFAVFARRAVKKADPDRVPGPFLNVVEFLVQSVDNLTNSSMGSKHGYKFANYIGTILLFIFFSNISGLFGLRPPTADYGVTLALGLITFVLIHFNGFKYQKAGHITGLFKPIPLLFPINLIGEIATPLSLSLRLFGNILSGTVLLGLIYGLLPKIGLLFWPAALHFYFDLFSGAIQTYVFCMLTMTFISQTYEEEEA